MDPKTEPTTDSTGTCPQDVPKPRRPHKVYTREDCQSEQEWQRRLKKREYQKAYYRRKREERHEVAPHGGQAKNGPKAETKAKPKAEQTAQPAKDPEERASHA